MTTVVFDGEMLATDSRVSKTYFNSNDDVCNKCHQIHTGVYHDDATKIHLFKGIEISDETIIALAGSGHDYIIHAMTKALLSTTSILKGFEVISASTTNGCADCILITDKNTYTVHIDGDGVSIEVVKEFPIAVGSGASAALMAMHLNEECNPIDAIICASKVDNGTGGCIRYFVVGDEDGKVTDFACSDVTVKWRMKNNDPIQD